MWISDTDKIVLFKLFKRRNGNCQDTCVGGKTADGHKISDLEVCHIKTLLENCPEAANFTTIYFEIRKG